MLVWFRSCNVANQESPQDISPPDNEGGPSGSLTTAVSTAISNLTSVLTTNGETSQANVGEAAKPDPRLRHMHLAKCLPYETESLEEMDTRLEFIVRRILDCVQAGDWSYGFTVWTKQLLKWVSSRGDSLSLHVC
jgi:hypothetical protein